MLGGGAKLRVHFPKCFLPEPICENLSKKRLKTKKNRHLHSAHDYLYYFLFLLGYGMIRFTSVHVIYTNKFAKKKK